MTDTTEHVRNTIRAEGGYADIETINGYLLVTLRAGELGSGLAIRVAFDPYAAGEFLHFFREARKDAIEHRAAEHAAGQPDLAADGPELTLPDDTLPPPLDGLDRLGADG